MANLNIGFSAVATGTADVITATYSPAITLSDRRIVFLTGCVANLTTTPTFNPNALGAQVIKGKGGVALKAGEILGDCILMYHNTGTYWELLASQLTRSTLAQILANGASTEGNAITGDSGNLFAIINDLIALLGFDDGSGVTANVSASSTRAQIDYTGATHSGFVEVNDIKTEVQHDSLIELDSPSVRLVQETASRVAILDASKDIVGADTAIYPSLTELARLKGVTSPVQTQIDGKSCLELMFGTTTVFNPADSTTYYFTFQTNLIINTTATLRQFRGVAKTIYSIWLYCDPQGTLGSNEDVTFYLRNITDGVSSLLGTLDFTGRGEMILMDVATPILMNVTKLYSVEMVTPAWATNPTSVALLGKLICR